MRKRLLAAGLVLVVAVALVASATAAKGKPSSAALRVQKSLTVNINKTTNYVTASGYIKRGGKKIAVKSPAYVVTKTDVKGYTCGSKQMGSGSKLKLQVPGAFKVVVTLRSKLKYNGKYLAITKMISTDLGGDQMRCAPLPSSPITPSQVCDDVSNASQPCGVPVPGAPAWLTRPWLTVDGSFVTVHAGEIASKSGCALKPAKSIPASEMWLGGKVTLGIFFCGDGSVLIPAVSVAYSPDGVTQYKLEPPYVGEGAFAASFQFPANCAGELDVLFGVKVQSSSINGPSGNEYSNAQLKLPGKHDCSQLVNG